MAILNEILVLGATGRVGSVIAHKLLQKNIRVRAVARNAEKLKHMADLGATTFAGDLSNGEFVKNIFADTKAAFILTPGNNNSPDLHREQEEFNNNIAHAIANSQVTHAVCLSSWGAELPDKVSTIYGCHHLEQQLNKIPDVNIVHLRPVWFMDNFIYGIGLVKMAELNGLSMEGNFSFPCIDSQDIGRAAAKYLMNPDFAGKSVHYLQGPQNYTMNEITSILGKAVSIPSLKYYKLSEQMMIKGMTGDGSMSANVAGLLVKTIERINQGIVTAPTRNNQNTTFTALEEFAKEKFVTAYTNFGNPSFLRRVQGTMLRTYLKLAS